jgi:hypothetical protein
MAEKRLIMSGERYRNIALLFFWHGFCVYLREEDYIDQVREYTLVSMAALF